MKAIVIIAEGECLPPWYYACAYEDVLRRARVFYPIPLHLLVRFGRSVRRLWNFQRSRPDAYSKTLRKTLSDEYDHGYAAGFCEALIKLKDRKIVD